MKELIRKERLENGLVVDFFDRSNRYFGDYHRLCLEVRCHIPLNIDLFRDTADPAGELRRAVDLLGTEAVFCRTLEKMGVEGGAMERTREELVESFLRSNLAYLGSPAFATRFVAVELQRRRAGRPNWPRI